MHHPIILSSSMKRLALHLRSRPRLLGTLAAGAAVGLLLPDALPALTRVLIGWNAGVWLYLALTLALMTRADHHHLRRVAAVHAEGAVAVMTGAVCAVAASFSAFAIELSSARAQGGLVLGHLAFAVLTLAGSWLLLPTLFAQTYASLYYRDIHASKPGRGLDFPGDEADPDYADFLYFALTIAATSQTSDVAITTREVRRWVTVQTLLAFAFNTALLALAINIAAGLL
jgi:uncharacterized membrane protein